MRCDTFKSHFNENIPLSSGWIPHVRAASVHQPLHERDVQPVGLGHRRHVDGAELVRVTRQHQQTLNYTISHNVKSIYAEITATLTDFVVEYSRHRHDALRLRGLSGLVHERVGEVALGHAGRDQATCGEKVKLYIILSNDHLFLYIPEVVRVTTTTLNLSSRFSLILP